MKVKVVYTVIVFIISTLLAYGIYNIYQCEPSFLIVIGCFIYFFISLFFTLGVDFNQSRKSVNIKVTSGLFFLIGLISNIIFALFGLSIPSYIITHGLLLMILFLIIHFFNKLEQ